MSTTGTKAVVGDTAAAAVLDEDRKHSRGKTSSSTKAQKEKQGKTQNGHGEVARGSRRGSRQRPSPGQIGAEIPGVQDLNDDKIINGSDKDITPVESDSVESRPGQQQSQVMEDPPFLFFYPMIMNSDH